MYHNVIDESVIINLAVDPAYQRKGYGKELLENTLNQLTDRGFTHFYLDVRVSNQAALALYEGFGFQRVGLRKGYYTLPDEDAYVMAMIVKREVI
jgi:ribosomal-protein-alanine N-acetyltransferase